MVTILLLKWLFKALELGLSNLQLMLRFCLARFQLYKRGKRDANMEIFMIQRQQAKGALGFEIES